MSIIPDYTNYNTLSHSVTAPEIEGPYTEYEQALDELREAARKIMSARNAPDFNKGFTLEHLLEGIEEVFQDCVRI